MCRIKEISRGINNNTLKDLTSAPQNILLLISCYFAEILENRNATGGSQRYVGLGVLRQQMMPSPILRHSIVKHSHNLCSLDRCHCMAVASWLDSCSLRQSCLVTIVVSQYSCRPSHGDGWRPWDSCQPRWQGRAAPGDCCSSRPPLPNG